MNKYLTPPEQSWTVMNENEIVQNYIDPDGNTIKAIVDDKHGVGVLLKNDEVDKTSAYDKEGRVFHSGLDPLNDVQIQVASKKRFMEWWRLHTASYPIRNHKGVVDSGKIIRLSEHGIDVIGADF